MTALQRFNLKNRMLLANISANFVAAVIIINLMAPFQLLERTQAQTLMIQVITTPVLFLIGFLGFIWYEWPVRRHIDRRDAGLEDPSEVSSQALRRLLNEPFFAVALDLFVWILAAIFWSSYFMQMGEPGSVVKRAFMINLNIGLITRVVAFFLLEHNFQKVLAPFFFPRGRIYDVPGTIRISIRVRLAALLLACNLVPFLQPSSCI